LLPVFIRQILQKNVKVKSVYAFIIISDTNQKLSKDLNGTALSIIYSCHIHPYNTITNDMIYFNLFLGCNNRRFDRLVFFFYDNFRHTSRRFKHDVSTMSERDEQPVERLVDVDNSSVGVDGGAKTAPCQSNKYHNYRKRYKPGNLIVFDDTCF